MAVENRKTKRIFSIKEFQLNKVKELPMFIFLCLFAVVQVYPLIWLLLFSFKDNAEIFNGNVLGLPSSFRWENYQVALTGGHTGRYFINSVIVTLVTLLVSAVLSSMVAFAVTRMKWKLSKTFLLLFLMGMMIPIHATLLPLFMILKNAKMLNSYAALIVPYVAFALPAAIYILSGFMHSIPSAMEEAACIDGCNIYQAFFLIILPLMKPGIATICIFGFIGAWNELMFAITFINKTEYKTLTVGIQSLAGQYTTQWGPIGAGLVVASLPTILIYTFASKKVQESLVVGAVKG